MKMDQTPPQTSTALLRNSTGVDTLETNSLCCAAAGIIAPLRATAEALIPHEKLREASLTDATLNAQERPPAQPAVGYIHVSGYVDALPESEACRQYRVLPEILPDVRNSDAGSKS